MSQKKDKAFLFGPFIGELSWEFYRFAPHAIYLKKHNPDIKIIVLTRESRFDLYGIFADILIPLRIKNEEFFKQKQFGLDGYVIEYYETIKKYFYEKYKKRFEIQDHFCPSIRNWRRKIKWQFPRDKMNYNFQPKEKNSELVNSIIREDDIIVDGDAVGHIQIGDFKEIDASDLFKDIDLGIIIESLKACEFVIGNIKFDISHLAVLLQKPLINLNEDMSDDSIHLLNPLRTPIIRCRNIFEGVGIYENNFRLEKGGFGKQRRIVNFNKIR